MEKPDQLIDLLMKERDYHALHPHEVFVKFIYGLGTSLATIVASLYFMETGVTDQIEKSKSDGTMTIVLVLFAVGVVAILAGLVEHTHLHTQHRRKIGRALLIILENLPAFDYKTFWEAHGKHRLVNVFHTPLKESTPLITIEPDTRSFWTFHDRKIELGVIVMIVAFCVLLVRALALFPILSRTG